MTVLFLHCSKGYLPSLLKTTLQLKSKFFYLSYQLCWLLTLPARMKSSLLEDFCSTYTYLYGWECKNRISVFCLIGSKPVTIVPHDTLPQLLLSIVLHSLLKIMHNSYYFDIKLMTYRKQNISLQQINMNCTVVTGELKKRMASCLKFFVDLYLHQFISLILMPKS